MEERCLQDSEPRRPIHAVLFDMDGLMIDTEKLYSICTNRVLLPYGKEMTWEVR